ncbi:MAG: polysaccharide biosynthesis tyrosine autokinase [Verrucomicrobia bacterium]|nr:polysaccharide biosynthesis tyrosine autokinase [Verrucomicrobiota bacterium]
MESFDLEAFLFEIRRFWWLILVITIVALGCGYAIHLLSPVEFKSGAKMVVGGKLNIPSASVYSEQAAAADFVGTQAAVMQSRDVCREADKTLRQQGKLPPEKGVELQATAVPKTTVFIVEATSTDPDYTRAYLQEAIRAYIELRKRMRSEQSREAVSALTEEVVRVRGEVDAATRDLNSFQQKISVGSLEDEVTAETAYLASLRKRYADLRLQKSIAVTGAPDPNAAAAGAVQDADTNNLNGVLPDQTGQQLPDQQLRQARQNLTMLQAEKARLQNNLRRDHPRIKQIDLRIREAQNLVGFLQDQIQHGNTERVESIDREMTALQDEISQREHKISQLNQNIAEYQTLKDRLAASRETYQRLTNSVQNVDVARQVDQEVINVLESPSTPVPVHTRLLVTLAMSLAIGLVIGVGATTLFSRLARRFQTISQIKRTLGLPVFGRILHDGWVSRQRTVLDCTRKHIGFAESFRNLRSTLMLLPPSVRDRRCIAVTSAFPNEGKSTIAVNMAIALAATNSRVLLIDADLRRGKLHQLLKVKTGPGFSDLLMRKSSVQQSIHTTRMQNLMLLPSGNRVPNVSEQIFRSNFDRTLDELCRQFDYVILDTPPVLATDDGPTMAAKAEWALFVVRLRHSRPRETEKALEELRMRQVEVPGVVVNSVSKRDTGHSYYHYAYSLEDQPFAGTGLPERNPF